MKSSMLALSVLLAGSLLIAPVGRAANVANSSGNWTDSIWSAGHVPTDAEDVVIPAGRTVTNNTATAALNSFTNSGTLIFTGWTNALTARDIAIKSAVTHLANTDTTAGDGWTPDQRVYFICTNFTLDAGVTIDVSLRGYAGGGAGVPGSGPGGGVNNWTGCGGGYGGRGGDSAQNAGGGATYGSSTDPNDPGSGSGGRTGAGTGAAGGGAVRIEAAGLATINGTINANGGSPGDAFGGGAAGGSVNVRCGALAGSGIITANGGRGITDGANRGGGGGGGRIAVVFDPAAQATQDAVAAPTVQFSATPGRCYSGSLYEEYTSYLGEPGTIYLTDKSFFPSPVIQGGQYIIPGATSFAAASLIVSNGLAIFPEGADLTVTNDLTFANEFAGLTLSNTALAVGGALVGRCTTLGYSYLYFKPGESFSVGGDLVANTKYVLRTFGNATNATTYRVGGNLVATNGGRFYLTSGMVTNGGPDYGLLVVVTGNIVAASSSWIQPYSHPTNNGAPLFRAANVFLQAGGGIDATGAGCIGGVNGTNGFGIGGGPNGGIGAGGGYGGPGGKSSSAALGGATYGSVTNPIWAGSGAGGRTSGQRGNSGGGLVRIEASGQVTVHGSIRADSATSANDNYVGGGSGGGVNIRCLTIASTGGLITANGGNAWTDGGSKGGGGGGGRIAIIYDPAAQAVLNQTAKPVLQLAANAGQCVLGANYEENTAISGQPGTIYLPDDGFFPNSVLQGGTIIIPGKTSYVFDSLIISNGLAVLTNAVSLTVSNDLVMGNDWAGIKLSNATVSVGRNWNASCANYAFSYLNLTTGAGLTISSNLTLNKYGLRVYGNDAALSTIGVGDSIGLTNGATLIVYAGMTNSLAVDRGLEVNVARTIQTWSGSYIFPYAHPTNGGTVFFSARDVFLGTNSGINANKAGFSPNFINSNGGWGYGYGCGRSSGGGGYGGVGGKGAYGGNDVAGGTYGYSNAPVEPGSAGGYINPGHPGLAGGGSVRIRADRTVRVDGMIVANGDGDFNYNWACGGGSGGGIYIVCNRFDGTNGVITAYGGSVGGVYHGGAGGGGRIAIWYSKIGFAGFVAASNGLSADSPPWNGAMGTVVLGQIPVPKGTVFFVR